MTAAHPPDDRRDDRFDGRRDDRSDAGRDDPMLEAVTRRQRRKERDRAEGRRGVAGALGTFGIVGWSVAVPTLVGVMLGGWIDARTASDRSWTLTLLIAGVVVGCVNAAYWVRREVDRD